MSERSELSDPAYGGRRAVPLLPLSVIVSKLQASCKKAPFSDLPHAHLPRLLVDRQEETRKRPEYRQNRGLRRRVPSPVPLFAFGWGWLELGYSDAFDDVPPMIRAVMYVKHTMSDVGLRLALSEVLPKKIGERLANKATGEYQICEPEAGRPVVAYGVSDAGKFTSAVVFFWLDGDLAPVKQQWHTVGLALEELVFALSDLIKSSMTEIGVLAAASASDAP